MMLLFYEIEYLTHALQNNIINSMFYVIQLLNDIQLYQKSLARFPAELARLETRNIVRTCEYNISARDF